SGSWEASTSFWARSTGEAVPSNSRFLRIAQHGLQNEGANQMALGTGVIRGHLVTLRRFLLTFWKDIRAGRGLKRRGGGPLVVDLFRPPARGQAPTVLQDFKSEGLFTVEYPDERLPVYERFRVLPYLIYDTEDGNVRCTSCNICAKVCPPQCIWMSQAK